MSRAKRKDGIADRIRLCEEASAASPEVKAARAAFDGAGSAVRADENAVRTAGMALMRTVALVMDGETDGRLRDVEVCVAAWSGAVRRLVGSREALKTARLEEMRCVAEAGRTALTRAGV